MTTPTLETALRRALYQQGLDVEWLDFGKTPTLLIHAVDASAIVIAHPSLGDLPTQFQCSRPAGTPTSLPSPGAEHPHPNTPRQCGDGSRSRPDRLRQHPR